MLSDTGEKKPKVQSDTFLGVSAVVVLADHRGDSAEAKLEPYILKDMTLEYLNTVLDTREPY